MLTRFELTFDTGNTIITLEEESIQVCKLWKQALKYSVTESVMINHIITATTNLYQSFVDIICKENNLEPIHVDERYIKSMSISDVTTPITYERVVSSSLFSKYSGVKS